MSADFAFSSCRPKNIFLLIAGKLLSFPLVLPRYHHLACLPASVRAALKTTLYKSRSMLSIDGRLVLKFHSRQNLFFKDSLAPTKDATFGQKFQSPQTFSKKCFVHCALPPTHDSGPSQNCNSY